VSGAVVLESQDQYDAAKVFLEQVIKDSDPRVSASQTAAKSKFMIGEIAFAQKKYEEAVEHFLDTALGEVGEEHFAHIRVHMPGQAVCGSDVEPKECLVLFQIFEDAFEHTAELLRRGLSSFGALSNMVKKTIHALLDQGEVKGFFTGEQIVECPDRDLCLSGNFFDRRFIVAFGGKNLFRGFQDDFFPQAQFPFPPG
jgi:hypothetical protein